MSRVFFVLTLVFLCTLSGAQSTLGRAQEAPPCAATEESIFKDVRICGKSHEGSLTKADVTVAGFVIGGSTLEEVAKRFPDNHQFRLTKEIEASTGICVKNEQGEAVVFSSADLAAPRVIDSIFIANADTFEKQDAKCVGAANLPAAISTESGIRLGLEKERVLALLQIPESKGTAFQVDYTALPEKALWLADKSKPKNTKGWVAMSGVYGGFRDGRLRWVVLYAGLSD